MSGAFQGGGFQENAVQYLGSGGTPGGPEGSTSDTAIASDAVAVALAASQSQTDTAVASDAFARGMAAAQSQTDTAVASDAFARGLGARQSQTDTAVATDVFARAMAALQATTDTAVASDAFAAALEAAPGTFNLDFVGAVTTSDEFGVSRALDIGFSDSATASDNFLHAFLAVFAMSFSEGTTAWDLFATDAPPTVDDVKRYEHFRSWYNRTYLGGSLWWRFPGKGR